MAGGGGSPARGGGGRGATAGRRGGLARVVSPVRGGPRLNRLYPKSIVKAPVSTILVPRPMTAGIGGKPLTGIALLEWARQVIDSVIDPVADPVVQPQETK